MYTEQEMTTEAIKQRLRELPEEELKQQMEALTDWYTVKVVAELNQTEIPADVMSSFAELCASLNKHVRIADNRHYIQTRTTGVHIVRKASFEEMLDSLASNEYSRMWSENRKEKEQLDNMAASAARPDAEVITDANTEAE